MLMYRGIVPLAQALVREGLRNVAAGSNPMGIKRGIETATKKVVDSLLSSAKEVETQEQIATTVYIASAIFSPIAGSAAEMSAT